MEQSNINQEQRYMSDSIDQLAIALSKAQGEFSVARKDKNNPFFKSKYADFESIVDAIRPSLTKHGLSFVQIPMMEGSVSYLITILMHSSGQWIQSKAQHNPAKNDIQSLSSYNTYLKRMCLSTMLGVVCSDEDDDGEAAVAPMRNYSNGYTQTTVNVSNRISTQQLETLSSLSETTREKILEFNKISSLNELTIEQYDKIMTMLKNRSK